MLLRSTYRSWLYNFKVNIELIIIFDLSHADSFPLCSIFRGVYDFTPLLVIYFQGIKGTLITITLGLRQIGTNFIQVIKV